MLTAYFFPPTGIFLIIFFLYWHAQVRTISSISKN